MSQPSEISRPAVRQSPWTRASVGIGSASSLRTTGISEPKESEALPSSWTRLKLLTSTPPVKMSPSARQTRARASEPSTSSMQSTRAPHASSPNRLSGGLESTIDATLPSRSSRIGVVVVSTILTSQFGGRGRDLIGIPGRGNPGQLQRIILVSGHDVDVEMEDRLPGRRPAGVDQVDPIGAEGLLHAPCKTLRGQQGRRQVIRSDLEQVRRVGPRDDERIPRRRRVDVHEGDGALVGVDRLTRDRARHDATEETVVSHAAAGYPLATGAVWRARGPAFGW